MALLGVQRPRERKCSSAQGQEKAIGPREKLVERLRMKEGACGTVSSKQFCHTERRGEPRQGKSARARSQVPPTPDSACCHWLLHKQFCDVKKACVLLELEDGNPFPAHFAGWLKQDEL